MSAECAIFLESVYRGDRVINDFQSNLTIPDVIDWVPIDTEISDEMIGGVDVLRRRPFPFGG